MQAPCIRFRSDIDVRCVEGDGVFLLCGARTIVLHGSMSWALAPLLDGRYTRAQIVEKLSPAYAPAQVHRQLDRLVASGLLVEPSPLPESGDAAVLAYWERSGVDAAWTGGRPRESTVRLLTLGDADAGPLTTALENAGLRVTETDEDAHVDVVVTDDLRAPELLPASDKARARHRPFWVVKLSGALGFVSPVLCVDRAACWHCAAKRLAGRHLEAEYVEARTGRHVPSDVPMGGVMVTGLVAHLAALRIARWAAGADESPDADALTFDAMTLTSERHRMARRPQCPSCGTSRTASAHLKPPVLSAGSRTPSAAGGERVLSPDALLAAYGHLVSPVTGIVTDLTAQTTDDATQHVYAAGHNFTLHGANAHRRRTALRSQSAGRGHTSTQARASALAEAIERFSGVWQGDEVVRRATWRELNGAAIHPDRLQLFSERQYRDRAEWNARGDAFQRIPARFNEERRHDWSPVWSLTGHRFVHVPAAALYYRYPHSPGSEIFCYADSNGNAAGGSLAEAVREGLLELIERDSVALWWYNRAARPAVALRGASAVALTEWREDHARTGREAWVLDVTSDLGIPAAVAVSRLAAPRDGGERILLGFGAALDMPSAVRRAMGEADQLRAAAEAFRPIVGGSRSRGADHQRLHDWWLTATLNNQPYLRPSASAPSSPVHSVMDERRDAASDVETVCRAVQARGLEALIADLTRPDIGLPVAKVLVPGLRHFWPRYAPGRLFDVPVRLGWIDSPTAENDLNPITMFM